MAISWKQAQEREADFWNGIYLQNNSDIDSYRPVNDEKAVAFFKKTFARFNLDPSLISMKTIADVGCGPYGLIRGINSLSKLNGSGPQKIFGIDPLMDTYKKFNTLPLENYIELITSKGESIPVDELVCDFVFSINVVDHVENPKSFLKECRRIMKGNGKAYISVHVLRHPFNFFGPILFLVDKNHPHHFSEARFIGLAASVFGKAKLTNRVTIIEDQPEFTFGHIFYASSKVRAIKRWLSNFVLKSIYIECEK